MLLEGPWKRYVFIIQVLRSLIIKEDTRERKGLEKI